MQTEKDAFPFAGPGSMGARTLGRSMHVKLSTIHGNDKYIFEKGDFIEVNVVHVDMLNVGKSRFILADSESYISGLRYHNNNTFQNREPLKKGSKYRIKNFTVLRGKNYRQCSWLRNLTTGLKFRNCHEDYEELNEAHANKKYDGNGRFIGTSTPYYIRENLYYRGYSRCQFAVNLNLDFIGTVGNAYCRTDSHGNRFKIVQLETGNTLHFGTDKFLENVALFGDYANLTFVLASVYAFSNVLVTNHPRLGLVLKTTNSSLIIEVQNSSLLNLQAQGDFGKRFIMDSNYYLRLAPQLVHENSAAQTDDSICWGDDDDELCQAFSQATKFLFQTTSSTSPSSPSNGFLGSPNLSAETKFAQVCVSPERSDTNSLSCVPTSPFKRTLPPEESEPSSFKKSRYTNVDDRTYEKAVVRKLDTYPDEFELSQNSIVQTPQQFYEISNQNCPYQVIVTPAKKHMDTSHDTYSMRSRTRGMALIINNMFENHGRERRGSDFDVGYLTQFLQQSSFEVLTARDVRSTDYRSVIRNFKERIESHGADRFDALFIAVLSHGMYGAVELVDEVLIPLYSDIIHQFDEYNYPLLAGKPKIFLVQTCQNLPSYTDARITRGIMTPPEKTLMRNMIICCSGSPGLSAYRDVYLGSYFIYVLVHVLMNHSHNRHFEDLLKKVQEDLAKVKCENDVDLTCYWNAFQFKKLYFNPGL